MVPYRYHLEFAELDREELQEFRELTVKIGQAMAIGKSDDDEGLTGLIMKRRGVLEDASAKSSVLREIFKRDLRSQSGVFVYCSSKAPEQLVEASQVLSELDVISCKVTAD